MRTRRLLGLISGVAAVFGGELSTGTHAADARPPNIVLILADDLGYGDPRCYNDQSRIPTPHIDRLASEGMRFTDAHAPSSVCTPTRYALLTGRYCWRTELKRSVLWSWDRPLIEAGRLTLPELLRGQGYATACIGKWHLGWVWRTREAVPLEVPYAPGRQHQGRRALGDLVDFNQPATGPTDRGFDEYFGDDVPNFPPYCFIENDRTVGIPSVPKPAEMFGHPGPALPGWDLSVVMPTLTQRAIAYIEEHAAEPDRPFFLYFPLTAPHTPIAPTPRFIGQSEAGWYGDFVNEVDWSVGQVLEALDRTGLTEHTLVIFTSDNGSPQRDGTNMSGPPGSVKTRFGHDSSRPWRGMKGDAWEAGHRVPFIVRWPGVTPVSRVSDEPIILVDLLRTIASIVNVDVPADAAEDSYDFSRVLRGARVEQWVRPHLIHHSGGGVFAIRVGEWKLIAGRGSGGFTRYTPPPDAPAGQLYNLASDPSEQRNVYNEHPAVVARLERELELARSQGTRR